MSGLASRAFRATGFWGGRVMLKQFERTARKAVDANRRTLRKILEKNAQTEFGKDHDFTSLIADPTGAAFRKRVPLSAYQDYAAAISRMEAGATEVLTADELLFFAVSSGTTGSPKLVPTTKRHHGFTFKYMGTVVQGVISNELHSTQSIDRGINLMTFSGEERFATGGTRIGGATAEAVRRMARIVPHLWNSPIEVYTLDHQPSAWYLHAIYGLRNPANQFVEAVFAPHLLEWLRAMETRWDELVTDIERGTLSDDLDISEELRRQVLGDNPADLERAAQLRAAAETGFDHILTRIWPHMTHLMTISTGSFSVYLPALRRYTGDLPIYSPSYGATESFIGVGLWPDRPGHYAMATDPAYFEFIPIAQADEDQPETVDMEGVEIDEIYELVATNHAGLYRYRIGDVIRVVDRLGQAPVIEFLYRRGTQFDLVGEKTTEDQVAAAVAGLRELWDGEIVEYTTAVDAATSPARYVVYLETDGVDSSQRELEQAAQHFDHLLCEANPMCVGFRDNGLLGRPRLAIVTPGTFSKLAESIADSDLPPSRSQLKTPRRIDDPRQLDLMAEAVVASS